MKQLILSLGLCLVAQFSYASLERIEPQSDTIPTKKWTFGLQAAYQNGTDFGPGGRFVNTYQLGLFAEYRFSSLFALEAELSGEKQAHKGDLYYFEDNNEYNFELSLGAKFYFGQKRRWFGKLGYFRNSTIKEDFQYHHFDREGFRLSLGHNIPLKNGSILKIEGLIADTRHRNVFGGIKIGKSF